MAAAARIALLTLSVGLVGCVTQPEMGWIRTDGKPVAALQFEADETNCRGESQKARLSSTLREGVTIGEQGLYSPRQQAIGDVFTGCMAGKGYVQRPVSSRV
jgi:hypothetical protein